jgi:chemosensory pili system protein ChpA (sensor histidine kinase/response regulator)
VRSGTTVIAISSAMVEQVLRLKADGITSVYDTRVIELQDRKYPLHYFQHLLGTVGPIDIQSYNSVLLLRSGIQRIALHVDELIGNQEIVVKNIGPQLARVPGVAGATVLPDGGIVLIMNPVVLGQRARQIQAKVAMELVGSTTRAVRAVSQAAAKAEATNVSGHSLSEPALSDADATVIPAGYEVIGGNTTALPTPVVFSTEVTKAASQVVMVVDDSLTVRKITSRLLEREGYTVLTAKDGVDALEQMKETLPGVMLVDIEMPRMDGFDLAKNVRGDSRTAGIPIIIISSRTADKHRNQAAQLGVNAFLGKPYQESELLQHVAAYLNA